MADMAAKLRALARTTSNPASGMSFLRDASAIAGQDDLRKGLEELATLEQLAIERGEAAKARAYRRQRMRLEAKLKEAGLREQAAGEVDSLVEKALSGVHRPVSATGPGGVRWVGRKFGQYPPRTAGEQLADGAVQEMSREEMLARLARLRRETAGFAPGGGPIRLAPTSEDEAAREALRKLAELNRLAMATGEKTAGPIHVARRTGRPRDGRMLIEQFGSAETALREGDLSEKERALLLRYASRPKRMKRSEALARRRKRRALGEVAARNPLAAYLLASGGAGAGGMQRMPPAMALALFGKEGLGLVEAQSRQAMAEAEVEQRKAATQALEAQAQAELEKARMELQAAERRGESEEKIAEYRARAEEARARVAELQAGVEQQKLSRGDPEADAAALQLRKQYWQMLEDMDADNWAELKTKAQALGVPDEVVAAYRLANPNRFTSVWDRFFNAVTSDARQRGRAVRARGSGGMVGGRPGAAVGPYHDGPEIRRAIDGSYYLYGTPGVEFP